MGYRQHLELARLGSWAEPGAGSSPDWRLAQHFLGSLHSWFNLAICLAVVRWCCGVFNGPFLCKGLEFTGCKLAAIIGYQLLGDTITRQARLKLFYHSWWFGVDELIQFPEVWFAADGNKILFVMMGEEVCSDFLPCSFRHFMRHKCLFAGCLFILSARPILLIPYSCLAKRHVP